MANLTTPTHVQSYVRGQGVGKIRQTGTQVPIPPMDRPLVVLHISQVDPGRKHPGPGEIMHTLQT